MATATDQQTNDMIKHLKQNIIYKDVDSSRRIGVELIKDMENNIIYPVRVYELYCDLIYGYNHIQYLSKIVDGFNKIYPGNARIILKSSIHVLNEYLGNNDMKLKINEISCMCTRLLYSDNNEKNRKYNDNTEYKNIVKFIVDSFLKHVSEDMLDKIIEIKSTIKQRSHKKESYIKYILEFFIRYNSPYLGELLTSTYIPNYLIKFVGSDQRLLSLICQNDTLFRYVDVESKEIKEIYRKYAKNKYYFYDKCVFVNDIDTKIDSRCTIS